jgi:hypothetical protein
VPRPCDIQPEQTGAGVQAQRKHDPKQTTAHNLKDLLSLENRDRIIRARSLKNSSILYEDFELRNEVTVTFPTEGIFQKTFSF